MERLFWMLSVTLLFLSVYGCSDRQVLTFSSGSHIPRTEEEIRADKARNFRYVVWGKHSGATQAAIELLQHIGNRVIERARLQEIFGEQQVQLTHSSDNDAKALRVGRLAGADRVVFVDVAQSTEWIGGPSERVIAHRVSVSVRSVDVETAEIQWSGTSRWNEPIVDLEASIPTLTHMAISRAICPMERGGYTWTEVGTNSERPGCNR
jgi:hypothetical protein